MPLNLKKRDLTKYDIEVHVDKSGSMDGKDTPTGQSRLNFARSWVETLVQEAARFDDDGVTVGFFNGEPDVYENTTFDKVASVFRQAYPDGSTDTARLIRERTSDYLDKRLGKPAIPGKKGGLFSKGTPDVPAVPADPKTKPRIILVITDGVPDDQEALDQVIVGVTQRMTKGGLTKSDLVISFIQVGNDGRAKQFLDELNNGLEEKGATMDIVGCITCDEAKGLTTERLLEKALDAE